MGKSLRAGSGKPPGLGHAHAGEWRALKGLRGRARVSEVGSGYLLKTVEVFHYFNNSSPSCVQSGDGVGLWLCLGLGPGRNWGIFPQGHSTPSISPLLPKIGAPSPMPMQCCPEALPGSDTHPRGPSSNLAGREADPEEEGYLGASALLSPSGDLAVPVQTDLRLPVPPPLHTTG